MLKNVTGQNITALLLDTDGAAVTTGTTTVYVNGDAGGQASMGTATHGANGEWTIDVTQAETNYDDIGFTWVNTGAVTVHQHVFTDKAYDAVGTAQADLDIITGAAGVVLDADAITAAKIADNAFLAVNFAAASLDGKGDWNTVVCLSRREFCSYPSSSDSYIVFNGPALACPCPHDRASSRGVFW